MSNQQFDTAPEDRIPFGQKLIYGLGAFVNNILAGASGGMMIALNLGFGMNPAWVGLLGSIPRLTDAITDPLMGYISDHTKSKWGRRRPYIFGGAILSGLLFILLWQLPHDASQTYYFGYFLLMSILFFLAYTVFATPWVALGYELTPDYHERTRLMGVQNFVGQLAYWVSPWFLWFMKRETLFNDLKAGSAGLAIIVGIACAAIGILPALFLRERSAPEHKANPVARDEDPGPPPRSLTFTESIADFFKGFATTLMFRPFQKLCVATFLVFNGFILISSFQLYVIIYYVFGGDQDRGSEYAGYSGTLTAVASLVVVVIVTMLATRIGKRRAFFVSTGLAIVGYALKWVCYNPDYPLLLLLPAPLMAFGLGGLFTLMPSMTADVVDLDELETNERREGMFGSIYWWVVKVGMAMALAGGGYLLNYTGFDVELGGRQAEETILWMRIFDVVVPIVTSAVAILTVWSYSITEERAHEIRAELDKRHATVGIGEASAS